MAKKKVQQSFNWQLYLTLSILVLLILPVTLLVINTQNEIRSQAAGYETIPTATPTPVILTR